MDRHRLEAVCHVVVIEVLGVELLDRGAGLNAAHAAEPAVERLERHDAVHQHEGGDHGCQRVAHLPRNQVDELEQARQADLDPEQTEGAPHEHERGGRAPGEQDCHGIGDAGQQFVGVRPGDRAERGLHPPAHSSLEHAADQGADQEDQYKTALIESVEGNGEQHGAKAVDGAERAEQKAGSILVHARIDPRHVEDDLDDQAEYAADHEDPEQVEEVELDIALAREVSAQHALGGRLAVLEIAQATL